MQVHGPSHIHGAQSLNGPHLSRLGHSSAPSQSPSIQDELELSPMGQLLDKVQELPDIRSDLVARIRAEIAAGTYETEEKLEIALERLLDEIG